MKNSKFWVWFIPLFLVVCIGLYNMVVIANKNKVVEVKDAEVIKELYSKQNDSLIKVELSDNNNYVLSDKEVLEKLFNNNGILYLGDASSLSSRKNVVLLDEVVSSTSIDKIYFVNISNIDEQLTNYLKDKLEVDSLDAGNTYLIKQGIVINEITANDLNNDKELSDKEKETLQLEYQEKILDLIEKCDENC
ncbi:MAG: hypothetical protein E7159_00020 [Firmicutes bacterium]|nr:hypothetical protein [Bacillota bacterium]